MEYLHGPNAPVENFFAPQYDPASTIVLNAARMTSITQVGTLWTVAIDATASNTPELAGAIVFPLRDISGVVGAGDAWHPPRMLWDFTVPPAEDSDMWVGSALLDGPDLNFGYAGAAVHFDAPGGGDRRRYSDTQLPVDSAPLAGLVSVLSDYTAGPSPTAGTFLSRVTWTPLDSALAALTTPGTLALSTDFTRAPHVALLFGSSTGGVATVSGHFGYERTAPVVAIKVGA